MISALTSSHQRRRRIRARNASTTSAIMLRSALFITESILQASSPTTRWGKMTAYTLTVERRLTFQFRRYEPTPLVGKVARPGPRLRIHRAVR